MFWSEPSSLVLRIAIGVLLGVIVALLFPSVAVELGLLGTLFVGLLKAIAPMLVMLLVTSALANLQQGETATPAISMTLGLYLVGTVGAALTALLLSYLFPQTLHLQGSASGAPPGSVVDVLSRILIRMVENPIKALIEANFLACAAALDFVHVISNMPECVASTKLVIPRHDIVCESHLSSSAGYGPV